MPISAAIAMQATGTLCLGTNREEPDMAEIIEFYVPRSFRRTVRSTPLPSCGQVIPLRPEVALDMVRWSNPDIKADDSGVSPVYFDVR